MAVCALMWTSAGRRQKINWSPQIIIFQGKNLHFSIENGIIYTYKTDFRDRLVPDHHALNLRGHSQYWVKSPWKIILYQGLLMDFVSEMMGFCT